MSKIKAQKQNWTRLSKHSQEINAPQNNPKPKRNRRIGGKQKSRLSTRDNSPAEKSKMNEISPERNFDIQDDFKAKVISKSPQSDFKTRTKQKMMSARKKAAVFNFSENLNNSGKKSEKKLSKKKKKHGSKKSKKTEFSAKYKTEICKNFVTYGHCKFGDKCSFAHGNEELRTKTHINLHYKSKICNQYFENGFCPYGTRCQYLHNSQSYKQICKSYVEKLNVWIEKNPKLTMDRILKKTHPFAERLPISVKLSQMEETQKVAKFKASDATPVSFE